MALTGSVLASGPNDPPKDAAPSCIEVEVDGARAPSYACLSERLRPTEGTRPPHDPTLGSEAIVQRPGNQLGVFNRAATGHRMGNAFGNSVYPQRPPVTQPAMPFGPRTP
ncbi:hypothetical protein J2W36_004720 [Variovorax ginsengisoli]|uniref:Uncharacterized protein n=1 Tax=Variovorax ginsengisoli TaxID=363844 RepID=A0ABT9SDJ9_9BURK|nr:hypothetical protein [Variovorax ginsengisoli]